MKKKYIIAIIVIFIIVALLIGIKLMTERTKTALTADEFKTIMSQKGYQITDATTQFSNSNYINKVYVAGNKKINYQIEFYDISDQTTAIEFFNNNETIFKNQKGSSAVETNVNGKNFQKYTLSTESKYKVISRIDNTVIYLNVDDNYKEEVKNALKELGY